MAVQFAKYIKKYAKSEISNWIYSGCFYSSCIYNTAAEITAIVCRSCAAVFFKQLEELAVILVPTAVRYLFEVKVAG